jgi:hypothetical protein
VVFVARLRTLVSDYVSLFTSDCALDERAANLISLLSSDDVTDQHILHLFYGYREWSWPKKRKDQQTGMIDACERPALIQDMQDPAITLTIIRTEIDQAIIRLILTHRLRRAGNCFTLPIAPLITLGDFHLRASTVLADSLLKKHDIKTGNLVVGSEGGSRFVVYGVHAHSRCLQ